MYKITLNLIRFMRMNIFVIFVWIYSRESATILLSPAAANGDSEILSYLAHMFRVFILLLNVRTEWKERKLDKVDNCLYLKVPKLTYFTNLNREKLEIVTSSPYQKIAAGPKKKTKTIKNQTKHKQGKKQNWNLSNQ